MFRKHDFGKYHPKSVYLLECKMKDLVMESGSELHWYGDLFSLSLCSSHRTAVLLLNFPKLPEGLLPLCYVIEKSASISIFVNSSPRLKVTFQIKFSLLSELNWLISSLYFSCIFFVLVNVDAANHPPSPTPRKFKGLKTTPFICSWFSRLMIWVSSAGMACFPASVNGI